MRAAAARSARNLDWVDAGRVALVGRGIAVGECSVDNAGSARAENARNGAGFALLQASTLWSGCGSHRPRQSRSCRQPGRARRLACVSVQSGRTTRGTEAADGADSSGCRASQPPPTLAPTRLDQSRRRPSRPAHAFLVSLSSPPRTRSGSSDSCAPLVQSPCRQRALMPPLAHTLPL